ncbi:MAG TPA: DUF5335 family protein [Pyrinomonadaceae bacterium]|jgi:Family of unknown function (DUF5335)
MPTQEIPRDEWKSFFDKFTQQHEGWLASLEIFAPDVGAQQEALDLPLEGISTTAKENGPQTIAISLGKTPEDHVTHTIADPTRLWLEQTSQRANAALEIESADEVKTLLRFRSPLPADMVDGAVLE